MARHEVLIHENTGATKESAPYLGSYIAKETVAMAAFAAVVGAKCGLPPIQVMAILGGAFDAIAALEAESLVRVHTDIGVVCAVITGSFPTADATFDPTRNALELALRLDERLRLDLADVTATIVTDADVTRVRVDNAMDIEEQKPMNLIHGKHVFRVAGFNMVLSDEGAAVFLQNSLGTTFPVTVDEVVSKQLFTAHTAELLEAGDYKLVVKSRGGDAAGPLQTSFRRVKYLRVVDPEPVPIAQLSDGEVKVYTLSDGGQSESFTAGNEWAMTAEGLFRTAGEGHKWHVTDCGVIDIVIDDGSESLGGTLTTAADGKSATFVTGDASHLSPGSYPAKLNFIFGDDGDDSDGFTIPITLRVGA